MFKLLDLLYYLFKLVSEKPVISFFSTLLFIVIYNILFVEKDFIIVTNTDYSKKSISRFNNEYNDIWGDGVTFIINNSNENLIFESINYTSFNKMLDYEEDRNQKTIIPPIKNKIYVLQEKCNYILITPPKNIRSKSNSIEKYWLYRE